MSLARCPACRVRLAAQAVCPRCGCDLTLVRLAEAQARRFVVQAVQAWVSGDLPAAQANALAATRLAHHPVAQAILRARVGPDGSPAGLC